MNVIIFGATGGIGKWAVKHALQSGHHVTAYVRNAQKITETNKNLTVIQGDIHDLDHSGSGNPGWPSFYPSKKRNAGNC